MASLVAVVSKRLRFPFTIGLVIIGLLIGWFARNLSVLQPLSALRLTPDIVLFVFLPVLLFESAFNIDTRSLMKNIPAVFMLAVPAMLISTGVVGVLLYYLLQIPFWNSLLFGALISATDPVAVISLFKQMGVPKRLQLLVEGESLFNDGTALVVFKLILGIIVVGNFTGATVTKGVLDFFVISIGGTVLGAAMGMLFARIMEKVWHIPLVEIAMSTILAHSSFIIAEHLFHVSGVIATVIAGLTLGSYGRTKISPDVLGHLEAFWEYLAFICNSLIFLLVGLSVNLALFVENLPAILLATLVVLVARAVGVYAMFPAVGWLRLMESVSMRFQTVIVWGGLRGALAIVMALSIPESMAFRPFILTLTFGIVLTNLLVNGLTVKPLVTLLGLDLYSQKERLERLQSMLEAKKQTMRKIMTFSAKEGIETQLALERRADYNKKIEAIESDLRELISRVGIEDEADMVMIRCLLLEKSHYQELFNDKMLSETTLKELTIEIDRYLDFLREGMEIFLDSPLSINERLTDILQRTRVLGAAFRGRREKFKERSYEKERARLSVTTLVLKDINQLHAQGVFSETSTSKAESIYNNLRDRAVMRMEAIWNESPGYAVKVEERLLERFCLKSELEAYRTLYLKGSLTERILVEMENDINMRLKQI